ncbi:FtsK/SpoIIIE domain-containing protein [Cellulosimicrobium sp. PMB13]|uniref:FtsK/SpoIIIE domain-containing protein n=1 Tax=Cellulosimicrobium sp. PMB13 TaxID=3120158 RepID=UPI003F4B17CF
MPAPTAPALPQPARARTALPAPRAAAAAVRVTLRPGTDVLLDVGVRLGDARQALADLTCRPELLTATLRVDGVRVDDDQRCGTRPLLPGATLAADDAREGAARPRTVDVLAATWHVAVLSGPRAGRLVPVAPRGPERPSRPARGPWPAVPPGGHARRAGPGEEHAAVAVDALQVWATRTRRGGAVRVRGPRDAYRVRATDAVQVGPAGAGTVGSGRRRRLSPRRAARWRDGYVVVHGSSTYALRSRPRLEHAPRVPSSDASAATPPNPEPSRRWSTHLTTALTPAVASIALAVTFRQPLYALLALVGPLALLLPVLLDARRRRTAARATTGPTGAGPVGVPGPGGAHDAAAGRAAEGLRPPDPLRPRPADVLTWAAVAHLAPDDAVRAAPDGAAGRPTGPAPGTTPDDGPGARLPDGCIAVVGPRAAALAAARAVIAELLTSGAALTVRHAVGAAADWSWCRWLPRSALVRSLDDAEPAAARLLVVDGDLAPGELAAAWERLSPAGARLVLVAHDVRAVPAWCRTVLTVEGDAAVLTGADGVGTAAPYVGVDVAWAEELARHLAAAEHLGRLRPAGAATPPDGCDPAAPGLPDDVSLAALLGAPAAPGPDVATTVAWVADRWRSAAARDGRGLPVPLGVGPGGTPVVVDLVADGPHVLVAGTTGAGKSELLQSLVAGLALGRSPAELTFALVDFKGGASFGACGRLPHVVGLVTDLDAGLAGRALAGLRAELRRREHVLAAARATSIDDLTAGTLPRLVVVIDEFRALADELPDFLPGLLRLAAQGRSLGVHLVLATQRPAGAVSADVRANITLRLALRVVDAADSRDVVESPHAALIPAGTPGRLVLRRGAAPPVALQCARAGAPVPPPTGGIRSAPAWGAATLPGDDARAQGGTGAASAPDTLAHLVDAARTVAAGAGISTPSPPWLPALPEQVRARDLDDLGRDARATLPLALGDDPERQRRVVVSWDPRDGHLVVLGRARSGRTTSLLALAHAALARGWHVHAIGARLGPIAVHPAAGTVVDRSDARRVARLLRLLARHDDGQTRPAGASGTTPTLVLVDDVEAVRATLSALAGGAGADLLTEALTESGAAFAVAGSGPTVAGLAACVGVRAVLSSRDRHDDVSLGVPAPLAGRGGPPGRAVWIGPGEPLVCQVVLPDADPPDAAPKETGGGPMAGAAVAAPLRLAALPATVGERALRAADRARGPGPSEVTVGIGGDDAGVLTLDTSRGALVVGPPGSGRTTALALIARQAQTAGVLRGVLARDAALHDVAGPGVAVAGRFSPAEVGRVLDEVAASVGTSGAAGPPVLVVDDVDQLAQLCVLEADRVAALCREDVRLVASATTGSAVMAMRGPLAELRARRAGIVLAPAERGSGEVFGHDLSWLTDPGRPRPGRGVLVRGARLAPVQVAHPDGE